MNSRPTAALVVAAALAAVAGCGGGGGKKATTTSTPTSLETPTSEETTSTTIDPALQSLLLVAADVPSFKEPASATPAGHRTTSCESGSAPAVTALFAAPSVEGTTFEKGTDGAVKVSSSAISTTSEQAGAGLTELVDPKVQACLTADLKASAEKDLPSGSTVTLKLTSAKATVTGVDQTVLLSGTGTVKGDTTASTSVSSSSTTKTSSTSKTSTTAKGTKTVLYDLVFLRSGGTILVVIYSGPSDQATSAERQRIVATAAKKLAGASGGTSSTTTGGSSTSTSVGGTTTSRKSTTTTRRSTTTTKKGTTSST